MSLRIQNRTRPYRFGRLVLDPRRRTLFRGDSPVVLTPKAFDVLSFLVRNPNRLVTKEELLQTVWGDAFVEEGNLTQYICHLRKALGDNSDSTRLIVTIARKGYQFTGDVSVVEVADIAKHATLQAAAENSRADARPVEFLTRDRAPKAATHWWKAVLVLASAVILVGAGCSLAALSGNRINRVGQNQARSAAVPESYWRSQ